MPVPKFIPNPDGLIERTPAVDQRGILSRPWADWQKSIYRWLLGTGIKQGKTFTVTVDFANIAAVTRGSVAVTVSGAPGIAIGDFIGIISGPELLEDDIIFLGAKVTGADQVTFYAYNPTAGGINPASQSFSILWFDLT